MKLVCTFIMALVYALIMTLVYAFIIALVCAFIMALVCAFIMALANNSGVIREIRFYLESANISLNAGHQILISVIRSVRLKSVA